MHTQRHAHSCVPPGNCHSAQCILSHLCLHTRVHMYLGIYVHGVIVHLPTRVCCRQHCPTLLLFVGNEEAR